MRPVASALLVRRGRQSAYFSMHLCIAMHMPAFFYYWLSDEFLSSCNAIERALNALDVTGHEGTSIHPLGSGTIQILMAAMCLLS